jgi:hypothetical protein
MVVVGVVAPRSAAEAPQSRSVMATGEGASARVGGRLKPGGILKESPRLCSAHGCVSQWLGSMHCPEHAVAHIACRPPSRHLEWDKREAGN